MTKKNDRQLNYEILRIVAMLMIITAHYVSKGGFIGDPESLNMTATNYLSWLVYGFCMASVNVYVFISGYFGIGDGKNNKTTNVIERPLKIWKQVFFYTVVIGIISMVVGIQTVDKYQIVNYIFPVIMEHYWFVTAYILLCLFMPFLNAGFNSMDKKQTKMIIIVMIVLLSVAKTIIPMHLPWDNSGCDVLWLVLLYLTGAYIRRYGIKILENRYLGVILYVLSALMLFVSFVVIRMIYLKTGKFGDFISYGYCLNFFFSYTAAIGLFMAFAEKEEVSGKHEKFRKLILMFSGATFGVYLIHEHLNIRYLWTTWFRCSEIVDAPIGVFIVHMIVTVIVMYVGCSVIEIIRQQIWGLLKL
jgi:surface polysaccharide O-acyltransferase-like enzyme